MYFKMCPHCSGCGVNHFYSILLHQISEQLLNYLGILQNGKCNYRLSSNERQCGY